jgi:hypothetical protein
MFYLKMSMPLCLLSAAVSLTLVSPAMAVLINPAMAAEKPVKVFLLAGQSNMVGHGRIEIGHDDTESGSGKIGSLRFQVNNDPANYGHLVDSSGDWVVREDIWVNSIVNDNSNRGDFTTGFSSASFNIGPEFGFGHVVGDLYGEQVLLIKTAWGGKSLGADFRSPTAVTNRGGILGPYYTQIIDHYNNAIANIATHFPGYNDQGVELVGMGWNQGYNDGFDADFYDNYEANMVDFIKDMRNDLEAPNMPFVIAETGNGNPVVMAAQAAAADPTLHPEFKGNVAFAPTQDFLRDASVSPTDAGYHWNANGESYYLIGKGMGDAMGTLVPEPSSMALLALGSLAMLRHRRN